LNYILDNLSGCTQNASIEITDFFVRIPREGKMIDILKKCGGCGTAEANALIEVIDKNQNRGYLCAGCRKKYGHLLQPSSNKRFWMCGDCGFRILAGTTIDAAVDPHSLCPNCQADVNASLVNLSGDKPVKTDMFGHPVD
jgi:DNA-directed RNA polymerase subunit RPC12/RpoP